METQEFARRIQSAQTKITQQIASINGTANSRSLDIFDTNAGGALHSYRIEQRRTANAKIERQASTITGTLYEYIKFLSNCQNCEELWEWLQGELMPRPIYKEGGGIDWQAWWSKLHNSALNTEYNRQYGRALQTIYSCFWV
ncbi:MAG: hypothetical protein HY986_02465 [Candidatus Melainabacteria bacterium]|nr:hypothetical protein [Candidatus Melainabacteria bacterium]